MLSRQKDITFVAVLQSTGDLFLYFFLTFCWVLLVRARTLGAKVTQNCRSLFLYVGNYCRTNSCLFKLIQMVRFFKSCMANSAFFKNVIFQEWKLRITIIYLLWHLRVQNSVVLNSLVRIVQLMSFSRLNIAEKLCVSLHYIRSSPYLQSHFTLYFDRFSHSFSHQQQV